jgi:hypothetical protein
VKQRLRRWGVVLLVVLGALVLLGAGAAVGVSVAEENDRFCAICHLNPERTYVDRADRVAQALEGAREQGLDDEGLWETGRDASRDLASAHRAAALNCVGCHRGDNSLSHRATALALGARNTLSYVTGQFDPDHSGVKNPTLVEASCRRCHVDQASLGGVAEGHANPVLVESFENHFHAYLFDAQYVDAVTIGCLDCHPSHQEIPPIVPYFINEERVVFPACVQCHIDVGQGPLDL